MVNPYPVAYKAAAAKYAMGGPSKPGGGGGYTTIEAVIEETAAVEAQWAPLSALDYALILGGADAPPSQQKFSGGTAISAGVGALSTAYAAYEVAQYGLQSLKFALTVVQTVAGGLQIPGNWTKHCGPVPADPANFFGPFGGNIGWLNLATGLWDAAPHAGSVQAGMAGLSGSVNPTSNRALWCYQSSKPGFSTYGWVEYHLGRTGAVGDVPFWQTAQTVIVEEATPVTEGTVFEQPIWQLAPSPSTYAQPQPDSPWHETGYSTGISGGGGDYISRPRREGRGERGRKFDARTAIGRALTRYKQTVGRYDATTEACDLIEVMYDSLPDEKKLKYEKGRVINCRVRLQQVYKEFNHIDWDAFVDNWLQNELEDQIVGRTAGQASKGYRQASGRQLIGGLTSGPAL